MSARAALLLSLLPLISTSAFAAAAADDEPVLVAGSRFPDFYALRIAEMGLFRWNAAFAVYEPVPFQLDERIDQLFNWFLPSRFTQRIYDVSNRDDGRLDAIDELAFLFGDAGPAAPPDAPWAEGSEPERYAIHVEDPLSSDPADSRWVYLFVGSGLPVSSVSYVDWTGSATTPIDTDAFVLDYTDRWLLEEIRIHPPCGTDEDLIDRFKGRAGEPPLCESEELWNGSSFYMGSIVGPVRAIRYVRGAASGINTIQHDIVYRRVWERHVDLRVHPIGAVSMYLDFLPRPGTTVFMPALPAGVPADGSPDRSVDETFVPWSLTRGAAGGLAVLYDVEPSPLYSERELFYRDDFDYDDACETGYGDEDDSVVGGQGIHLTGPVGQDPAVDPIHGRFRVYPLCANEGSAALGSDLQARQASPLQVSTAYETRVGGPVHTLQVARYQDDVLLAWNPVPGASSYRVYSSPAPDVPPPHWTLLGETAEPIFVEAGGALGDTMHYSVVGFGMGGEGEW